MVITKNLGDFSVGSGWYVLLQEIEAAGFYVNLDLSAAAMTGTEFNPIPAISTGKNRIVSIILPNDALSIPDPVNGDPNARPFIHFDNLQSVSGANITTIGEWAFAIRTNLTSVNLPAATTIGMNAFAGTTGLTSLNFPAATNIEFGAFQSSGLISITFPASVNLADTAFMGTRSLNSFTLTGSGSLSVTQNGRVLVRNNTELAFYPSASGNITMENITSIGNHAFNGTNITSANFPAVTHIGDAAFWHTPNLTSVSFPIATTMGHSAFGMTNLKSVSFPMITDIGLNAFWDISSLTSVSFPMITNIGRHAFANSNNIEEITIAANVTFYVEQDSARIYDFITHYNSQGQAAGTYTFVSGAWTGP